MSRKLWFGKLWFGAVALLLLLAACSRAGSGAGPEGALAPEPARDQAARESAFSSQEGEESVPGSAVGRSELPAIGPAVIKTAEIRIEIGRNKLDDAVGDVTAVAGRYGGFVASTQVASGKVRSGILIIRVPAGSFEQALADLRGLGKVRNQAISGQDVTQEFVDLEARLRNWRAQEDVLLRLMDRARTVSDSIRVQRELQQVQLEIEMIQGRLRFLRDQTEFGTITVGLREVTAAAVQGRQGTLARAWSRAADLFMGLVSALVYGAIVGGAVLLPLAVLALLGLLVYRWLRPRLGTLRTP